MRDCGAVGIHYRRRGGCTRPGDGDTSDDLVNRAFDPEGPDRLWVMDVTEHRTGTGKVYLAVVIDAWSRRVVGWSIADHMRAMALTTVSGSVGVFLHGEHHQQWDHGPNKPPLPCSTLCAMACALVYAPPFEVQTPQPLALSDHPASVTQRELSDAPSGKPFRPPISLST